MTLLLDNPAGAWALTAVPAIVLIHFLRPAARRARVSTLFLLEHLEPGTSQARRLRRLRTPPAFWLQILAALLLTWLLIEPRWVREGSRQTVVVVLDASASMHPFRGAAEIAVREQLAQWAQAADHTTWLVRESDPRRAPLYQGESAAAALASLARWQPDLGEHDLTAVIHELRYALGLNTPVVLVTDHPVDVPPGVAVAGVGSVLANVGFVGAVIEETESGTHWRVLVRNASPESARRTLTLRTREGTALGAARLLDVGAGKVLSVEGAFPAGVDEVQLELSADAFDLDDRLPLVRLRERELRWNAAAAALPELLQRLAGMLEFSRRDEAAPDLRLRAVDGGTLPPPERAHELVAVTGVSGDRTRVAPAPVVAERHPLVEGLTWDGLISGGPAGLVPPAGATVLLWQGGRELVWLEQTATVSRLALNFDVARSNAARLPAFVVLLDRYVASLRANLARASSWNGETHQRIDLGAGWRRAPGLQGSADVVVTDGRLSAPGRPGFFAVRAESGEVLRGAARFGDAREADFQSAASFRIEGRSVADAARAASQPDPWRPLWLLAVGGCLFGAWWCGRGAVRPLPSAELQASHADR